MIKDLKEGNKIEDNKKFTEYYSDWINLKNKKQLSSKQFYWYEVSIKLFSEVFGLNMLVKNITRSEYQRFLNKYAQDHTDETVRKVHGCLARSIRDALYDGYLKKDPTYDVSIKGTEKLKMRSLSI